MFLQTLIEIENRFHYNPFPDGVKQRNERARKVASAPHPMKKSKRAARHAGQLQSFSR
jgi:hypothetical protein